MVGVRELLKLIKYEIEKIIEQNHKILQAIKPRRSLDVTIFLTKTISATNMDKLTMNITDDPKNGHIVPKNAKGGTPLTPPQKGTASYSSSDEAVFTVDEDPSDETKFKITPVGVGKGNLTASIDADPGDGVVTVSNSLEVEITPDEATTLDIVLD